MSLTPYHKKRDFRRTPEPSGTKDQSPKSRRKGFSPRFCIQLHAATKRHYDLRLEIDGTMKSWAVPKGPSLDPLDRRLAVQVEDHPIAYCEFEGIIPPGNYGAGTVMIWDEGMLQARGSDPLATDGNDELRRGLARGDLKFVVKGQKINGEFALVRLKKTEGNGWLLLKKRDAFATTKDVTQQDRSVRSGRSLGDISATALSEGKVWLPKRTAMAKPRLKQTRVKTSEVDEAPKDKQTKSRPKGSKAKSATHSNPQPAALPAKLLAGATLQTVVERITLAPWRRAADLAVPNDGLLQPIYEGYRVQVLASTVPPQVQLISPTHRQLTARFPQMVAGFAKLRRSLLLDGLIVPVDADGRPRQRGRLKAGETAHYLFVPYDILHVDGYDLRGLSMERRQKILAVVDLPSSLVMRPPTLAPGGDMPDGASSLLARRASDCTVFSDDLRRDVAKRVKKLSDKGTGVEEPAGGLAVHGAIQATGSSYEVVRLGKATSPPSSPILTNLNKVFWPEDGFTKGELIDYYRHVSPWLLPHLKDRPESLNRHPNGILGQSFFQKDVAGHTPGWISTATLTSGRRGKSITYLLCQNQPSLLYLANLGCIELNPWLSRIQSLNHPDFIVIDLDPDQVPFTQVVEAALVVRRILDGAGIVSCCKTSGSRGLHIYVPIAPQDSYDEVRSVAYMVCQEVHRRLPATTSLERSPERRRGRIYLDFLQNRIGQTMAAVYAVRPRPGATVSTPLRWSEVNQKLDPKAFTIKTILRRIDRLGDLWPQPDAVAPTLGSYAERLKKFLNI